MILECTSIHQHKETYQLNKEECIERQIHQKRLHNHYLHRIDNSQECIEVHQHRQTGHVGRKESLGNGWTASDVCGNVLDLVWVWVLRGLRRQSDL